MRQLIITGDDFGLAVPVNEAIETAHRRGILTAASLMVGADATEDAVARAQRTPSLKVGLHLVLVEGRPILSPALIPDLVNEHGEFSTHLITAGVNFFFRPGVRRQLQSEITAQFLAFRKTGLTLDHVNAHNHMHVHPTILGLILKVGKEYGLSAMRLPYEPLLPSWRASRTGFASKFALWALLFPWMKLLKVRLKLARVRSNDFVFGLHDSGHVNSHLVLRFLMHLPEGVTEIYFHPATRRCSEIDRTMPDYEHEREFEALMNPVVKEALERRGFRPLSFSEL
jgi:hopanoid biosynthesis associated protein HpnK